ncbi:sirohydrochlorin chelatase [Lederbergia sp. NSJ-179]|uniref:sirohydrochlorin chelatase n=1 Tax=Lederbergia sp. NSJ-179 TaxID=2931402 RepID=UPI001FD3978C|nr:sirohydrochlorin chelatase [Lederbergia sp. NSJ-179]MCJ7841196.1 sirohydrochlorin chelatase [Lederbergia sp. NSJ-179]
MQAILYISHGSRLKAGVKEATDFIQQCQRQMNVNIQEICFLELVKPSIAEGIENCIQQGATHIAVVPLLLLTAVHAKKDIPYQLKKAKEKYPQIDFAYGSPLGIQPKLMESLYDQLMAQKWEIRKNAEILIVGRGSSDPEVKRDLNEIASRFQETYRLPAVHVCFLYGATPHFDETVAALITEKKQIIILPYLLFNGLLIDGIRRKIKDYGDKICLCETLGHHPNVQTALLERIRELLPNKEKQWVI